jgi:hypothetical protein
LKKVMFVFLIAVLATVFLAAPVQAQQGPPVGGCPPGFMLHHFMDHGDHHEHHIGLAQDLNQDGMICVKHLPNGLHVHMDNVVRP